MNFFNLFYKVITILYGIGCLINIGDGAFDIYQAIVLVTLFTGWYLIDNK